MTTVTTSRSAPARVAGLDNLRGAVMILMAIDHVRVYSGVPAGGLPPGVFFTRWVTHFCAPVFVFLAGTAAFLHLRRHGDRAALARYLLVRGLMLVALELTVIRFAWTFNWNYSAFTLAGVIWMLGWCMVLMSGLIWLPAWAVGAVGFAIVVGQNAFQAAASAASSGALHALWQFVYLGDMVRIGASGSSITVLYTIVPWIGVMALGYSFGAIVLLESRTRRRVVLGLGLAATAIFVVVGAIAVSADAADEQMPAFFRLLNQRKYPASPLFLLMTLGPSLAVMPLLERAKGALASVLETFGRVPLFYYLLHIPLIHATSLLVFVLRDGAVNSQPFATAPYVFLPEPQRWSLPLLYLVFAAVIAMLYPPCRWYAEFKSRHPRSWARYV
jgi:uncharacterized membrane protein